MGMIEGQIKKEEEGRKKMIQKIKKQSCLHPAKDKVVMRVKDRSD